MKRGFLAHPFAACLLLSGLGLLAAPLAAQDSYDITFNARIAATKQQ